MRLLNIGEKITQYKEKLNHSNFQEFGRAANCSGDWIKELSKKTEIKFTDMNNVINLCKYLGIQIEQLVVNDEDVPNNTTTENITDPDDIGFLLNELVVWLDNKEGLKLDGVLMNDKCREICKDSLGVVRTLVKQHL